MIFIGNDISRLQYYINPQGAPCYCDPVVYPTDLILQGNFASLYISGFAISVYVYSTDGITQYEDATSYFEYYFFPFNGRVYFNLRCKSFSQAMCNYGCYVMRVVVSNDGQSLFDSYTQAYCQNTCCDTPRGITYNQESLEMSSDREYPPTTTYNDRPRSKCGEPYITIRTTFDCIDLFTGDYYDIPTVVYQGVASWSFQKITNLVARFAQRPREITRQISYNCNLERSESFKPYVLQSTSWTSFFPTWKMNELEGMFHANHIYVNPYTSEEKEYQFAGGAMFEQLYSCWEMFKLNTTLQTCTIRQTFSCQPECSLLNTMVFVIPGNYSGTGFYSDSHELMGYTYEDLLNWFASQQGITLITDVSSDYPDAYGAFRLSGPNYIPSYFYYDQITPRNTVYGSITAPDVNSTISPCGRPVLGDTIVVPLVCEDPVLGSIVVVPETSDIATVNGVGSWNYLGVVDQVTITGNVAKFSIVTENLDYPASGSPLIPPYFDNMVIGVITANGRPSIGQTITNAQNPSIPLGSLLQIDTYGNLIWSGEPTGYDMAKSVMVLNDIYYNI